MALKYEEKNAMDEEYYRSGLSISLGGKELRFLDGEPEDASLNRDFSDVYNISELVEKAYEAGKAGEELEFSFEEVDWEDL